MFTTTFLKLRLIGTQLYDTIDPEGEVRSTSEFGFMEVAIDQGFRIRCECRIGEGIRNHGGRSLTVDRERRCIEDMERSVLDRSDSGIDSFLRSGSDSLA